MGSASDSGDSEEPLGEEWSSGLEDLEEDDLDALIEELRSVSDEEAR